MSHSLLCKSLPAVAGALLVSAITSFAGSDIAYDDKGSKTVTETQQTTPPSLLDEYLRPSVDLRYDYNFPSNVQNELGKVSDWEAQLRVPLPPVKTDTFFFLPELYYRFDQLDINTKRYKGVFDLSTLRVPLQAAWLSPNSPWFVYAYFEAGFSSDFDLINSSSFDIEGSLDIGYRFSPNFILAAGALYTNEYGRSATLPSLGFVWAPCSQVTMALAPTGFNAVYKWTDDCHIKLEASPFGGRWTVKNDGVGQRLEYTGGHLGLLVEHRLFKQAWVTLGGGVNLFNNLRVDDTLSHKLYSNTVDPGLYLSAGLRWQF